MVRLTKKFDRARSIVTVHLNLAKPPGRTPAEYYAMMVKLGYYWNVARQDWQHIKLTLTHIGSVAEMSGKPDTTTPEYYQRLVDGGILIRKKDGTYKRTKRVDLPGKYGDFGYGR